MLLAITPLLIIALILLSWTDSVGAVSRARLAELRKSTVEVFQHGFNNYMQHAFPEDELRPISCTPLTRDPLNPNNYELNDVLGNYSLTLIDSLSTLAILAGSQAEEDTSAWALEQFQTGVEKFVGYYGDGRAGPSGLGRRARGFDLDSKVQVFETVIRGVGGLLSAHLFAVGELPIPRLVIQQATGGRDGRDPLEIPPISWPGGFQYDGQLLRLALDLAERLLPAFYTPTGIPYPRVNLRHGIPFYVNSPLHKVSPNDPDSTGKSRERTETCSAGAGSLVLEFSVLSRLSGDQRFENLAKRAFWAVWNAKSEIGLVGNGIDPEKGEWVNFDTGIGAGVDSFFEYALKSHILLSGHDFPNGSAPHRRSTERQWLDPDSLHENPLAPEEHTSGAFLEAWHQAHAAIKRHLYNDIHHPYYMTGHRTRGHPFTAWIDSLAAFYPGLLAMAGEVDEGEKANLLYTALWTRYGAIPERWSVRERQVDSGIGWWPGRPEFIESTYYLYRATGDPWYLHVGEMVLSDIVRLCRTKCGWSGLQDVDTGEKADRMQSFFLGETTKYLYLLFDPDHPFNKLDSAFVFSTEAHPLIIPRQRKSETGGAAEETTARHTGGQGRGQNVRDVDMYYNEAYTNSCPVAPKSRPLTGSVLAARPDVFHAASFVNLHKVGNPYSGIDPAPARKGSKDTAPKYKSNHTFFPWTLPRSMIPEDGMCSTLPFKPTIVIEFPPLTPRGKSSGSQLNELFVNAAAYKTVLGVKITSLNGLKVTFVRDESYDSNYDYLWRVTHVNHFALGKDELVHLDAELLGGLSDPLFNRIRYASLADLIFTYEDQPEVDDTIIMPVETKKASLENGKHYDVYYDDDDDDDDDNDGEDTEKTGDYTYSEEEYSWIKDYREQSDNDLEPSYRSKFKSLMQRMSSVFDATNTAVPDNADEDGAANPHFVTYKAALPVGKGAVPLPDVTDNLPLTSQYDTEGGLAAPLSFPWTTVYHADQGCSRLPEEAPRDHQVIVMRRGGCSFSAKLENIPSFTPSPASLQLVVVVDESDGQVDTEVSADEGISDDERHGLVMGGQVAKQPWVIAADMTKPHLETEQTLLSGIPRHRPVSMVLIRSGKDGKDSRFGAGSYDRLRRATGVGIRRKYFIETQGRRVENIIVL